MSRPNIPSAERRVTFKGVKENRCFWAQYFSSLTLRVLCGQVHRQYGTDNSHSLILIFTVN